MLNYYRRFLPGAAEKQGMLRALINGNKKNDKSVIKWKPGAEQAFAECKHDLANVVTLAHPVPNGKLILNVDASNYAVGAALHQLNNGSMEPLGFYSKRMTDTQKKYSTYHRELLAIYQAVKDAHARFLRITNCSHSRSGRKRKQKHRGVCDR